MSATQRDIKWSVVVADHDRQPAWLRVLADHTGKSVDDLVTSMIEAEMSAAGEAFMAKWSELFVAGTGLV